MNENRLKQEYKRLKNQYGERVKFNLKEYIDSRTKGNYSLDAIKQRFE